LAAINECKDNAPMEETMMGWSLRVNPSINPAKANLQMGESRRKVEMNWKQQVDRLGNEARVLYFIFKHPRTRWYVKWIAACPVAYVFSPIQLIPNFIPVIGFLDDFLFLAVGAKLIRKLTPPDLLVECHALADATQTEKKESTKPEIARIAIILAAVSLFLAAIGASAVVAAFIRHS
jgi:uncharacterized membrane protein YkvA (DUF1232 family)